LKNDCYDLSPANLKVLRTVPEMMNHEEFRKKLRTLTVEFLIFKSENRIKYRRIK